MRRRRSLGADRLNAALIALVLLAAAGASTPRSARLATVSGAVVVAGEDAVPPGTRVHLKDLAGPATFSATPDAAGRFRIDAVPVGRFTLAVTSQGYVGLPHGASHVRGLEVPVAVGSSDVADLRLDLVRTGTISGMVRDRFFAPVSSIRVSIQRWTFISGTRALVPALDRTVSRTGADGRYRVEGLPPGDYVVSASMGSQIAATDVYPETFYPAAVHPADATHVRVESGGEVIGIGINLSLIRASRVDGELVGLDNSTARRLKVWARPRDGGLFPPHTGGTVAGDAFRFPALVPGAYVLEARAGAMASSGNLRWTHSGRTTIVSADGNLGEIPIVMGPTVSLEGTVALERAEGAETIGAIRVLLLEAGVATLGDVPSGTVDAKGRLTIAGITPGSYWVRAELPDDWTLQSLRDRDGADIRYTPLRVEATNGGHAFSAVYAERAAHVEGTLRDAAGQPTSARAIVVFPSNPSAWEAPTSNVFAVRPDTRGRFILPALPEGAYFLAPFQDHVEDEWKRPEFLHRLAQEAAKIAVPRTGTIVQDLRIR